MPEAPLVIGLGNGMRGDDCAGLRVAELLAAREIEALSCDREPISLLELWRGRERVVVIDAACGPVPGRVWILRPDAEELPLLLGGRSSTHLLGLADVIELARELGRLPAGLTVVAIEGDRFELGAEPSAPVERAIVAVAEGIVAGEIDAVAGAGSVVSTAELPC